jgi:hypothetical protein
VGLLVQEPLEVVSVCPCVAVPEIAGSPVLDGGNGVTAVVALDRAAVEPPGFVAVTTERIVDPTSVACNA